MNKIESQSKSVIYASLRTNFNMWTNEDGVYGYKKLIRPPGKIKKVLKKSIFRDVTTNDRTHTKECPKPKKLPVFSYKQLD